MPNVEIKASYLMSEPHARHCNLNSPSAPNFPSVYQWSSRDALVSYAVQIMVCFECCMLWCLYTYGNSPSPIPPCACLNGREMPTFKRPMLNTRTSNLCVPGFNLTGTRPTCLYAHKYACLLARPRPYAHARMILTCPHSMVHDSDEPDVLSSGCCKGRAGLTMMTIVMDQRRQCLLLYILGPLSIKYHTS